MAEGEPVNYPRDTRGRFGPGNPGGPGGSKKRKELRRAVESAISSTHIEAMIRKAAAQGLQGDVGAMRLVFDQTIGKPRQADMDAEALDIQLPSIGSPADCGRATDVVLSGITTGKVNGDVGRTLLDGINTRLQAFRATQEEREAAGDPEPARQLPADVLWALFLRFKKTGILPDNRDEAIPVVDKVVEGYDIVQANDSDVLTIEGVSGFVEKPRPKADNMDNLLYEAAAAPTEIRTPARFLLKLYASRGFDLTTDLLKDEVIPEFGPVSWHLIGMREYMTQGPHQAQAERLFRRMEAMQQEQPTDYDRVLELRARRNDALNLFQFTGRRPDDPKLLEDVLLIAEMSTLESAADGEDVDDVLELFDTIAQKTGAEREEAISKLQKMAKDGRFMQGCVPE